MQTTFEAFFREAIEAMPRRKIKDMVRRKNERETRLLYDWKSA
jgi:hypothetical protein